eukprot:4469816-Pleurochrysis_carterae.AAC.1
MGRTRPKRLAEQEGSNGPLCGVCAPGSDHSPVSSRWIATICRVPRFWWKRVMIGSARAEIGPNFDPKFGPKL